MPGRSAGRAPAESAVGSSGSGSGPLSTTRPGAARVSAAASTTASAPAATIIGRDPVAARRADRLQRRAGGRGLGGGGGLGGVEQPAAGGQHEDGQHEGDTADEERDAEIGGLGQFAGGVRGQAAADEPDEAVRRGGDRPLHRGDQHDRLRGQRVVDADERAADDHRHDDRRRGAHADRDDGHDHPERGQVRVQGAGGAEPGLQPRRDEHAEDRHQHAPAEEDQAELVRVQLHRVRRVPAIYPGVRWLTRPARAGRN
jgi:hypothetical protein